MLCTLVLFILLGCIPREDPPERQPELQEVATLPEELNENSGMIAIDNLIWLINDSGDEPVLYGYDRNTNMVTRKVYVKNTENIDWEDITQNDHDIFIGDFGNNDGSRDDLRIIRISKTALTAATDTVAPAGLITFSYEDQTDYTPANQATRFDCEAFIATADSLILFTKDWIDYRTQLYTLPLLPGQYLAKHKRELNVEGLVTSAAYEPQTSSLYLAGYLLAPFLWIYSGFDTGDFNFSDAERIDFEDFGVQVEAIFVAADGVYVSSEKSSDLLPATLFRLQQQ